MLFLQLVVVAATIQSVLSCPAAKKSNLRPDEVEAYHRQLSEIIGIESRRLEVSGSQVNQPICNHPSYIEGVSRGTAGDAAANANIQVVYEGVRTFFYALIDSIQNGTPQPADATLISKDPLSLFPLDAAAPVFDPLLPLDALRKEYRVANLLGNALRLVFHDAGEVDIRTADLYGSDGCLSDSGPNSGLKEKNTIAMTIIEPLWQKYCDKISRADFWVLFGKIAAESALPNGKFASNGPAVPGGPNRPAKPGPSRFMPYLNIPFQYGRPDYAGNCDGGAFRPGSTNHRLPGHQPGLSEFTEVYVKQMGLTVRDGVILSGAHTVGHVHTAFSGFGFNDDLLALEADPLINAWDETPFIFDNDYYNSLAGEPWLNNDFQPNVIQNEGGNPHNKDSSTPVNSGANFWAVQLTPGVQQAIPVCAQRGQLNCGTDVMTTATLGRPATVPVGETVIFCNTVDGLITTTHYATTSLETNPSNSWEFLTNTFGNPNDFNNHCNCAQFFAIPPLVDEARLYEKGCATAPHPKIIMLNADMVQAFPISGAPAVPGGQPVRNLIASNTAASGYIVDLGKGDIGEICGPIQVDQNTRAANGFLNSNLLVANTKLTYPLPVLDGTVHLAGFGCVKDSGNVAEFVGVGTHTQDFRSSLLPADPNNVKVSLFATVQSFMTNGAVADKTTCINGVSVYKNPLDGNKNPYTGNTITSVPNYLAYNGAVASSITGTRFIGQNTNNGLSATASCNAATPTNDEGRDHFYREFEVAWTKMVTVGFKYSHTFKVQRIIKGKPVYINALPWTAPGGGKLGTLYDIVLKNPRQRAADVASGLLTPLGILELKDPTLPTNSIPTPFIGTVTTNPNPTTWGPNGMTGGYLLGSSTCYLNEANC